MFSSTIDLSLERRENRGEGVQEGEEEKRKKEMESTRDREKKHGTRLVPCSSFFESYKSVPLPRALPFLPPITTPLNGFKRPRRRQWGRHATGLANLPHQLAKKFLIYRPTDFYPLLPPWRRVERGSRRKKVEESCPRYTRWRDVCLRFCESFKYRIWWGMWRIIEMEKLERLLIFVHFYK